ncbi:hypothetical protein BC827DRAFT_658663 [Russula dissimulans]|nr:hypothetical protein BC827DRAFT_658663 [Russula dissimulans]
MNAQPQIAADRGYTVQGLATGIVHSQCSCQHPARQCKIIAVQRFRGTGRDTNADKVSDFAKSRVRVWSIWGMYVTVTSSHHRIYHSLSLHFEARDGSYTCTIQSRDTTTFPPKLGNESGCRREGKITMWGWESGREPYASWNGYLNVRGCLRRDVGCRDKWMGVRVLRRWCRASGW